MDLNLNLKKWNWLEFSKDERGVAAAAQEVLKEAKLEYDSALPITWLKSVAAFAEDYLFDGGFVFRHPYRVIVATTFWVYPKGFYMGLPWSCCTEVAEIIKAHAESC